MFLNITPTVANWTSDNKQFSLIFDENPLADFVELPDDGRAQDELWYSNILCGIIRGALEMVRCSKIFELCNHFSLSHIPCHSYSSCHCRVFLKKTFNFLLRWIHFKLDTFRWLQFMLAIHANRALYTRYKCKLRLTM